MAKTVDSKVAVTALKEAGAIPLVPYTRSSAKWKSRCKTCQNIIYPRYSVVKKGHHPCGSCGRFFSGANRRKKLEKKRISEMKKAGLLPKVDYPGTHKPWKSMCVTCKKIVYPHFASIARGSGCIYCAGRKVDESDVRKYFKSAGYTPIGPYPGAKVKWKAVHRSCGATVYPEYSKVKQGRGCSVCAGNQKVSEASAKKLFLRNYLKPLEPFVNSQTPWRSKCLKCGKTVSPNYAKVKSRGHQCAYCAGSKIDEQDAVSLMKRKGFIPKVPYPGGNSPWKMQCKKCKRLVSPNYSSVKAGSKCKYCMGAAIHPKDAEQALRKRGYIPQGEYPGADKPWLVKCKTCKRTYKIRMHSTSSTARCSYCAGRRVDVKDVYKHMKEIGLKPLEEYVDARTPIKCRCNNCLRIISPTWSHIKNKVQGCAYCAKRRLDPLEVQKIMLKAQVKPVVAYQNSKTPWECVCLKCKKVVFPRLGDIKRGQSACIYCAGRKTDDRDAIKLARSLGFEPLENYPGANKGWKCRCLNCSQVSKPHYTTMQQRGSGCRYCADSGFDYRSPAIIYLITNKKLKSHKIGVAGSGKKNERLSKHKGKGWTVYKIKNFKSGDKAFSIEQKTLYWLRVNKDLPAYLLPKDMPQGGSSETVDASEIDLPTIWAKVEQLSRVKK